MKRKDLTGQRFGKLVAIRDAGYKKGSSRVWLCKCDCGKFTEITVSHLTEGQTGCGCGQKLPKGQSAFNSLYSSYQRNAKTRREVPFELTKKQFRNLTQEPCFYCGSEPSNVMERKRQNGVYVYNGIDRLDNTKGYSVDNCVSCCKVCNWMKNTMSYKEFIDHIKKICTVTSVA